MNATGFGDLVIAAARRKKSSICMGLDPRLELLPAECLDEARDAGLSGAAATARAFSIFCKRIMDAVAEHLVAVKPQSAFFELLGSHGVAAFESVCHHARELGLIVIADVKRGDIGSTAAAYARAYLAPRPGELPLAHACTVNPYLGSDGIAPFLEHGVPHGGGIFVLVKTSNPSSSELQDLDVGGRPVFSHVASLVRAMNEPHQGASGYGPVGAVVGATWPELLRNLRKELATSILLLPGYGAQGGGPEDVLAAFDSDGSGALVTASRSLTFPWAREAACPGNWLERVGVAVETMFRELEQASSAGA